LDRLIAKYDLEAVLADRKITLPPEAKQQTMLSGRETVTAVTTVTAEPGSRQGVLAASEAPQTANGAQNEAVTAVTVVTVSEPTQRKIETPTPVDEAHLDARREAALQILRGHKDGLRFQDAVAAVMAVYPDRDEATHFMNRLVGDGLFGLSRDGRWRLMK